MSQFQMWYTTPQAIGRVLQKADPGLILTPAADQWAEFLLYIADAIKELSGYLTSQTSRVYVPYRDTKLIYFDDIRAQSRMSSEWELDLRADLLAVVSVDWADTVLTNDQYRLVFPSFEGHGDAAGAIKFDRSSVPQFGSEFGDNIGIEGIWGWHASMGQMWETVETITLANGTATSVTVSTGAMSRYETYQYLRCESEYLQITGIADTALTVRRGVNGTTAAAHSSKSLEVYRQSHEVDLIAGNLGAFMYQNRVPVEDAVLALDEKSALSKWIERRRRRWFAMAGN